jgi:hypothetical protein
VTQFQARMVILADEWLGAAFCGWVYGAHREAFWPVFVFWAACVYGIGYPSYWRKWDRWWS